MSSSRVQVSTLKPRVREYYDTCCQTSTMEFLVVQPFWGDKIDRSDKRRDVPTHVYGYVQTHRPPEEHIVDGLREPQQTVILIIKCISYRSLSPNHTLISLSALWNSVFWRQRIEYFDTFSGITAVRWQHSIIFVDYYY